MAKSSGKGRSKRLGILLLLLLLGGVGIGGWWLYNNRYPVKGIDVSRYQGKIDWKAVHGAGISFAFIKATEGLSMVDPYFKVNWEGAGENDMARGAYHFFRPSMDGAAQATQFLKLFKLGKGDLPAVLDLEETDDVPAATIRTRVHDWLDAVERGTGRKPIIYTLPHYARSYLDKSFAQYPLWIADLGWFGPSKCGEWKTWNFWQHSHHGKVAGIDGEVDLNVFNGSLADLERFRRD